MKELMDFEKLRNKSLRDFTDEELTESLEYNEVTQFQYLCGVLSEILRLLNKKCPLFSEKKSEKKKDVNNLRDFTNEELKIAWDFTDEFIQRIMSEMLRRSWRNSDDPPEPDKNSQ